MIRLYLEEPFPDDCGTDQNKVLCCVPTLKHYLKTLLHKSQKGQVELYFILKKKAIFLQKFKIPFAKLYRKYTDCRV